MEGMNQGDDLPQACRITQDVCGLQEQLEHLHHLGESQPICGSDAHLSPPGQNGHGGHDVLQNGLLLHQAGHHGVGGVPPGDRVCQENVGLLTQLLLPLMQPVGSFQAAGEVAHQLAALLQDPFPSSGGVLGLCSLPKTTQSASSVVHSEDSNSQPLAPEPDT